QHKFHKIVCSEVRDKKFVLLGHSMGSLIARLYASRYPQTLSGLIILGTTRAGLRSELAIRAAARSVKKNGPAYVDRKLNHMVFGSYNDRIQPSASGYDWLTRDPDAVRQYQQDPKCGFPFT